MLRRRGPGQVHRGDGLRLHRRRRQVPVDARQQRHHHHQVQDEQGGQVGAAGRPRCYGRCAHPLPAGEPRRVPAHGADVPAGRGRPHLQLRPLRQARVPQGFSEGQVGAAQ